MSRKIDISHKTIIFITAFILGLLMIYLIKDLLLILFVAIILMSALEPLVNFFHRLKIPRALGIPLTYIIIIAVLVGILAILLPPLVEQSSKLVVTLPPLLSQLFAIAHIDKSVFQTQLTSLSANAFSITLTVFDNFLTIIFLLVITFYLLLERKLLETRISSLFVGREERVKTLITNIQEKLGSWMRGQLFLSVIIGMLSFIGLTILDIPYALPLALIAGIMEVVPVIGPIISSFPAILVALTISPVLGLIVGVMYFVIQQLENHLIVPQVMKKAVGLNPLVVILTIAVGSRLLGFAGALLAVPIAVVIQILVTEIIEEQKL
ncbi:MAG: AI-2E family transporter [Candidatus Daviesbacteria bacterium]|nr:AI-2E family transporter [Candidatus Daviesbacteria bacterium]